MGFAAILTIVVVLAAIVAMARNLASPDLILVGGLTILLAFDVLTPSEAFSGFSNAGILSVAVLLVVAAGVRETGGLDLIASRLLGSPKSLGEALVRMMAPVAGLSAFMGNTAVVAMGVGVVQDWAKRLGRSPSRLLLPLSYAAILGGMCTVVGTSTNLVVVGLYLQRVPDAQVGIFDVAVLGLPALAVGFAYILGVSKWMPPDRGVQDVALTNPREYSVVMLVEEGASIAGRRVEDAGLRHLPGLYLAEVQRTGVTLPAVGPDLVLREGDQLVFVGIVESVKDLARVPGLVPAGESVQGLAGDSPDRCLIEAVVSGNSSLVGQSVRDSGFRTAYDATILAVHRHGERVEAKVGDIVLEPGDTLLIDAHPSWARQHRNDGNYLLVSEVEGSQRPRRERAVVALGLLIAMVLVVSTGMLPLLTAGLLTAAGMLFGGCLAGADARRAVDVRLLLAIGAAFGIGAAVEKTGVAAVIAEGLVELGAEFGPAVLLIAVYLVTALLTELITNAAAAALIFPVAAVSAEAAGLPLRPFVFLVMIAASASFSTPIGYQTNLMVYGPGGYRFSDYLKFGLPLQLMVAGVTVAVTMFVWL